jgi:hypothetical protein
MEPDFDSMISDPAEDNGQEKNSYERAVSLSSKMTDEEDNKQTVVAGEKVDDDDNDDNLKSLAAESDDKRDQQSHAHPGKNGSILAKQDNDDEDDDDEEQWEDNEVITAVTKPEYSNILDNNDPIPRKKKRIRTEEPLGENGDSDNDGGDGRGTLDVSISDLKRQIMGRQLRQEGDEMEDPEHAELAQVRALMHAGPLGSQNSTPDQASTTLVDARESLCDKLKNDMACAICHDIFYPPVSLLCGHTFCRSCLDWWLDQVSNCPTCRQVVLTDQTPQMPNLSLRACVVTLFGKEIVARLQSDRPRGEQGGAHGAGHQVVQSLEVGAWSYIEVTGKCNTHKGAAPLGSVQVRRNIVLDADDQRMQLSLAIYRHPMKTVVTDNSNFYITLCMLRMEEDEVADSGFPANLILEEDEAFICSNENQFVSTFVEVKLRSRDGHLAPLARVARGANGFFACTLDSTQSTENSTIDARAFLFEHSETGTQLEVDFAQLQSLASGGTSRPPQFGDGTRPVERARADDFTGFVMGQNDYSDTDEDQDEFEEDGFVVANDVDGESSDDEEEDDDCCCLCHEDGEVMICDGGKENDGCKQLFHARCVGRDVVPDGDWICQACAVSGGIGAGPEGHEFRTKRIGLFSDTTNVDAAMHRPGNAFTDDDDDDDDDKVGNNNVTSEIGNIGQQPPCDRRVGGKAIRKGALSKKRRMVLEDSDSD